MRPAVPRNREPGLWRGATAVHQGSKEPCLRAYSDNWFFYTEMLRILCDRIGYTLAEAQ